MKLNILARATVATVIAVMLWPFAYGLLSWLQVDEFIAGVGGAFLANLITSWVVFSMQRGRYRGRSTRSANKRAERASKIDGPFPSHAQAICMNTRTAISMARMLNPMLRAKGATTDLRTSRLIGCPAERCLTLSL